MSLSLAGMESADITFLVGGRPVALTATTTITATATNLVGATVSMATIVGDGSTYRGGEDVLSFVNATGITGSFDLAMGVLTLTGTASVANYQAALRAIKYGNNLLNPTSNIRRIQIVVTDGSVVSNPVTRYIDMTPLVSTLEGSTYTYHAGDAATQITGTLTLPALTPSGHMSIAAIQMDANYVVGQDVMAFTNTANITGVFYPATGVMRLTGNDTVANYQAALRAVTYKNLSPNPSASVRRFSITVNGATSTAYIANRYFSVGP